MKWSCFRLSTAAGHDLLHTMLVLPAAFNFFDCVMVGILGPFRGYINAMHSEMQDYWPFREVGFSLHLAVVKEETKEKKLDSGSFLTPLSPLCLFFCNLVLVGKIGRAVVVVVVVV